jgi:hypothetical protein
MFRKHLISKTFEAEWCIYALPMPICGAKGVINCKIKAYTRYVVVSYR